MSALSNALSIAYRAFNLGYGKQSVRVHLPISYSHPYFFNCSIRYNGAFALLYNQTAKQRRFVGRDITNFRKHFGSQLDPSQLEGPSVVTNVKCWFSNIKETDRPQHDLG